MAQTSPAGESPANVIADFQSRALQSCFDLATRRSQAMTEYLRSLSSVRQPDDLMAVQMSFWSQMMNDYSSAMTESLTPLTGADQLSKRPRPGAQPNA